MSGFAAEAEGIRQCTTITRPMKPYKLLASLGALLAAACGPEPWTGPLAAVADSVLAGGLSLDCNREELQAQVAEFRYAEPPFNYCQGSKGDTSVFVTYGAERRVIWVNWQWRPDDGQTAAYELLLERLEAQHGPSHLCPQSDDLAATQNRRWQAPGMNFGVVRLFEDRVGLGYVLGPIDCHGV